MDSASKMIMLETLDVDAVVDLLRRWDLLEFVEFARERHIDGQKLADVTEGLVKLWRPKVNAKKLIQFVEDVKLNPGKYFDEGKTGQVPIECQYQTVRKIKSEASTANTSVEELLKKLVPAKSFLYRHHTKVEKTVPSYLPMDGGIKQRKFFRLSFQEYPYLNVFSKYSKHESQEDRGYYSVKTNSRYLLHNVYKRQESRTKYKSLPVADDVIEKLPEDHFYEDLCYNEVNANEVAKTVDLNQISNGKPCLVKLQELFQSFKLPFFKKTSEAESTEVKVKVDNVKDLNKDIETNLYENELAGNMYDSVHVCDQGDIKDKTKRINIPVEEYLEPVQLSKDYCDITLRQKEESLMGYIMSLFEKRFGIRRETSDSNLSEESEADGNTGDDRYKDNSAKSNETDDRKSNKMADRPLPVPVENESYYMNLDRAEAENLLKGQPDGTFILRPSSQSNHAYTLSVSCANQVHNVGVRRRPDGRLALGFPRRGERSFQSIPTLLRHHKRRRLLLVAAGGVVGATTLNESADYYQAPRNIPVVHV
ncbi:hypothetical protein ACJJTC_003594 [Scirpophaga incertulas]